jgi:hypothetical protein
MRLEVAMLEREDGMTIGGRPEPVAEVGGHPHASAIAERRLY